MELIKRLIKEYVCFNLILEAQSISAISSAIANYLRIKHKNMSHMVPSMALGYVNSAVDDMMRVKGIDDDERIKAQLVDLVIKELAQTGDIQQLKKKEPIKSRPAPQPSAEPQEKKFSLRGLFGL